MGYGDFKLLAALGAWLGWQVLPVIVLLSSVVGAVIGITLIVFKGRDHHSDGLRPLPRDRRRDRAVLRSGARQDLLSVSSVPRAEDRTHTGSAPHV